MVNLANGNQTPATGVGWALLVSSLSLESILYVPKSPFNLISVSKITRLLNYSITLYADSIVVQDHNMGDD